MAEPEIEPEIPIKVGVIEKPVVIGIAKYPLVEALVMIAEPMTRVLVAIAITAGFMKLSMMKEISGDSYTNVFFIIIGFLFGRIDPLKSRVETTATATTEKKNGL